MRITIFLTAAASAALMATGAAAHPGPKLLTAGGAKERTAATPGVSFQEVNGVHLFEGSRKPAALQGEAVALDRTEIEVAVEKKVWRSFRSLRTQGFYTGRGEKKSRRYTQGFYSGR